MAALKKIYRPHKRVTEKLDHDVFNWTVLLISALDQRTGNNHGRGRANCSQTSQKWIDEWLLRKVIQESL